MISYPARCTYSGTKNAGFPVHAGLIPSTAMRRAAARMPAISSSDSTIRPTVPGSPTRSAQCVFTADQPAGLLLGHELDLGTQREREVGDFVAGREIGEDGDIEIGQQVSQEILEFVLFGTV